MVEIIPEFWVYKTQHPMAALFPNFAQNTICIVAFIQPEVVSQNKVFMVVINPKFQISTKVVFY